MKPWLRRTVYVVLIGMVLLLVAAWIAGNQFMAPVPKVIGAPPTWAPFESVSFDSKCGARIRGWFCPAPRPDVRRGTVILLHGYAGDRRASLGRVRFLRAAGFATLCIDLRSHGESDGDRVTFGQQEPHGVRAAVKFVRARRPGLPVICLGESLGGVACLLGEPPLAVDALIVEMVFPTMHEAVSNRVTAYLGGLASAVVTPLLTYQCAWRMDASLDELAPELAIHRVRAPLFVIGGEFDDRTPPAETRRLFAAANEPKELWIVPGAGHQNLHSKAGSVYEQRILAFLQRHVPGK